MLPQKREPNRSGAVPDPSVRGTSDLAATSKSMPGQTSIPASNRVESETTGGTLSKSPKSADLSKTHSQGFLVPLFDLLFEGVGFGIPSYWFCRTLRALKFDELGLMLAFDLYILGWLLIEMVMLVSLQSPYTQGALGTIILVVCVMRMVDLLHVSWSILLYDRFRKGDDYIVSSARRSLLINLINYCELVLIFALIYYVALRYDVSKPIDTIWTAIYFSIITITTVGYGEFHPITTAGQITVGVEILAGYFFAILILGRVIQILPKPRMFDGSKS